MKTTPVPDRGFVLPYVLIVIAILAVAGTIAAARLSATTATITALSDQARTAAMIDRAEADVTFAVLGGNSVRAGIDLNPESPIETEFGLIGLSGQMVDQRDRDAIALDVWSPNGSLRRVATPDGDVVVSLRDVSGFPSLNKTATAYLTSALTSAGLQRAEISDLLVTLADYTDIDTLRRQGGAEAPDYTLRGMAPPTNAPLRTLSELGQVMGWAEVMPRLDLNVLAALTTLDNVTPFRPDFRPPALGGARVSLDTRLNPSLARDTLDVAADRNTQPSTAQRISFYAPRGDGRWDVRVIELTRQPGHISRPYRRRWVLDKTVLRANLDFDPAQITELDYVINPASLRP